VDDGWVEVGAILVGLEEGGLGGLDVGEEF
jgi:hypothetical protein